MTDSETTRRTDAALISVLEKTATSGERGAPMGMRDVLIFALVIVAFVAWVWLLVWAF